MQAILAKLSGIRVYLYIGLASIVLATATFYAGVMKGHSDERVTQAEARAAGTLEGVKAHAKINQAVGKMSDPDLDADLSKWMRD